MIVDCLTNCLTRNLQSKYQGWEKSISGCRVEFNLVSNASIGLMAGILSGSISGGLTRIFKKVIISKVSIDNNKLKVQRKASLLFLFRSLFKITLKSILD